MAKVYGTNNLDVLDGDFRRRNGGCKLSGSSGRGIHDVPRNSSLNTRPCVMKSNGTMTITMK
jgi:hypothetical protein